MSNDIQQNIVCERVLDGIVARLLGPQDASGLQHLRLVFDTHEISIRRNALAPNRNRDAADGIVVRCEGSGQRSLITDGQPVVLEIAMIEANAPDGFVCDQKWRPH